MPGSPPARRRRAPPSRPSSPTRRSRSRSWCRRPSKPHPLHGQRAGDRRPFFLCSAASEERNVTADFFELVFGQASELSLFKVAFNDEACEDHRKLRIAIVEQRFEVAS